jgi:dipeptidyl aminopeptidase/acylaminoacyl peptidase
MGWSDQYLKLAMKSRMETVDRVRKTKNSRMSLLRTRCFLKKLREELEAKPTDIIRRVEAPVLILHGKEDELIPAQAPATLDKALEESGNKNHKLIYYSYLGHFFGPLVNDGINKAHYEADKAVLDTIVKWLDDNLLSSSKIDLTL